MVRVVQVGIGLGLGLGSGSGSGSDSLVMGGEIGAQRGAEAPQVRAQRGTEGLHQRDAAQHPTLEDGLTVGGEA